VREGTDVKNRRTSTIAALVALGLLWACVQALAATGSSRPAGRARRWAMNPVPGDYHPFSGIEEIAGLLEGRKP
jgi:hypothetical protein